MEGEDDGFADTEGLHVGLTEYDGVADGTLEGDFDGIRDGINDVTRVGIDVGDIEGIMEG
jgi:hypothetical protein